ncbi:MAG: ATPase domain-containing protein [Candidatus Thermoplasmatota archaeon]|nr:ATPase domain-containing protein [Candidatus Thermoplasmatota archaeon]
MFHNTVTGLDKVFKTDIKRPKVVLVTGPPGSMKSSFIYSLLTRYLNNSTEFGVYTTLEESVSSHLGNMESLGIDLCMNLQITDFTDIRGDSDAVDYLKFLERMLKHFKKIKGDQFTSFTLDSLGALYSLMEGNENMRKKMYHFFQLLRDLNLYSFIIMERSPDGDSNLLGNEGFLADGIIYLGLKRRQGRLSRFLQVEKMRACEHSMELHAMDLRSDGLAVLGPIFD